MTDEISSSGDSELDFSHVIKLAELGKSRDHKFDLRFSAKELQAVTEYLGVIETTKMRFHGTLVPQGRKNWQLKAQIGATVTQACVATLAPVKTRVDVKVLRKYVANYQQHPADSVSRIDADDTIESLCDEIDLVQIALEAVVLEIPEYPRAQNVVFDQQVFTAPDVEPMSDEAAKPFAGLAALKAKLEE